MSEKTHKIETIYELTDKASVVSLVAGIILVVVGFFSLIFDVGFLLIVFGVLLLFVYYRCAKIKKLIKEGLMRKAKEMTLWPALIGFVFGGVLIGVLLLIAYVLYDDVLD